MSLELVQYEIHNLILNARRLERIISTNEFMALFSVLNPEDQSHVLQLIRTLSVDQLTCWVSDKLKLELGPQSIRDLRLIASQLKITGYASMTKDELTREILHAKKRSVGFNGQIVRMESHWNGHH